MQKEIATQIAITTSWIASILLCYSETPDCAPDANVAVLATSSYAFDVVVVVIGSIGGRPCIIRQQHDLPWRWAVSRTLITSKPDWCESKPLSSAQIADRGSIGTWRERNFSDFMLKKRYRYR